MMDFEGVRSKAIEVASSLRRYVFEEDERCDDYSNPNSALHNDMNRWGATPLTGFVTGLGRTVFGGLEFAVGALGYVVVNPLIALASGIEQVVRGFLGREGNTIRIIRGFYRQISYLVLNGGRHLRLGLKETLIFGCHQRIAQVYRKATIPTGGYERV